MQHYSYEKADKILFDKWSIAGTMWHWHHHTKDIVSQLKPCSKYEVLTKSLSLSDSRHFRESAVAMSFHPRCHWFVRATFTADTLLSSPLLSSPLLSSPLLSSPLLSSPLLRKVVYPILSLLPQLLLLSFSPFILPWSTAPHLLWGLAG